MFRKLLFLVLISYFCTGCASILSKSFYPLKLTSTPTGAKVIITNQKGEIFTGNTPATVQLNSGVSFFKKAIYEITFSEDGFEPKTYPIIATLDGWYFMNIFIGGVIGMLIVDPATGAMYKINEQYLDCNLSKDTSMNNLREIKVFDLAEIPCEWEENLIKINTK
ncbi:MAG: hypothetical protein R3E32_02130 [Chitinophagales bacterium]